MFTFVNKMLTNLRCTGQNLRYRRQNIRYRYFEAKSSPS